MSNSVPEPFACARGTWLPGVRRNTSYSAGSGENTGWEDKQSAATSRDTHLLAPEPMVEDSAGLLPPPLLPVSSAFAPCEADYVAL